MAGQAPPLRSVSKDPDRVFFNYKTEIMLLIEHFLLWFNTLMLIKHK
jgi:hypothetical protein